MLGDRWYHCLNYGGDDGFRWIGFNAVSDKKRSDKKTMKDMMERIDLKSDEKSRRIDIIKIFLN